jgi:hypothetical protein
MCVTPSVADGASRASDERFASTRPANQPYAVSGERAEPGQGHRPAATGERAATPPRRTVGEPTTKAARVQGDSGIYSRSTSATQACPSALACPAEAGDLGLYVGAGKS